MTKNNNNAVLLRSAVTVTSSSAFEYFWIQLPDLIGPISVRAGTNEVCYMASVPTVK